MPVMLVQAVYCYKKMTMVLIILFVTILKKLNKYQRNYSTIEKECLSLTLALQHFEVYLSSSVAPIIIFTDHNPLTFIHKMEKQESMFTQVESHVARAQS